MLSLGAKHVKVSICVLTYNRCEQLLITLGRLKEEFEAGTVDFYVLNNCSTDNTAECIRRHCQHWSGFSFIHSDVNLGCAKGREVLWRHAVGSDYILAIDDDILLKRLDLFAMLDIAFGDKSCGVVSPLIRDVETGRVLNPVRGDSRSSKLLYEGCFLIKRELIEKVGYFDPNLKFAGEGLDYLIRLRRAGYSVCRAPEVVVDHVDRKRNNEDLYKRRVHWAYSFAYLYAKNYNWLVATLFTAKHYFAHLRFTLKGGRYEYSYLILKSCRLGFLEGYRRKKKK